MNIPVDGGALSGDITAGGSEGIPNNKDSDSLGSILENIPDDPDNEDSSPDEGEGTENPALDETLGELTSKKAAVTPIG